MDLNLVQHRDERSVWDQLECGRDTERWVAGTLASALFLAALRRRSGTGLLFAVAGGTLAWWACAGADQRTQWRGDVRAALPRTREHLRSSERGLGRIVSGERRARLDADDGSLSTL